MLFNTRTKSTVITAIAVCVSALAYMTTDERYVAAPGLTCIVMVLWLWMVLWERDEKIPFIDVGMFCALATLVYTVYPLVNFWVDGLQFGLLSDNRLHAFDPLPIDIGVFHLRHVLYLFSFVCCYAVFRDHGSIDIGNINIPNHSHRKVIFTFFLLLTGYFLLLQLITGVNYNTSYEPDAFSKNMDAISSLPLIVLQISSKLGGILFLFKLALLFIVVNRYNENLWRNILLLWLSAEIIQTFMLKGSRTGLVLILMATALFYHRMIRALSIKFLITSGVLLFSFFIFLGLYRSYENLISLQTDLSQEKGGGLSGSNEFQSLLGTAYDVNQLKEAGAYLPWYLYINDISTILPPQQFMPFEKVAASEWYLREIGHSGTGVGLMWGVISQSIVGLDWLELALRGAVLGYILGRFHNWYLKHQSGFLETLVYVYFCLKVYNTFRDTTFIFLANLVWEVIPFYIVLRFFGGSQNDDAIANKLITHHKTK